MALSDLALEKLPLTDRSKHASVTTSDGLTTRLRELYEGDSERAQRFRYALLLFDVVVISYIVATSFFPDFRLIPLADGVVGILLLADFLARQTISRRTLRELLHPVSLADMIAITAFLASVFVPAVGFLRVLRTLRLLHSYQLIARLTQDFPWLRRRQELAFTTAHLAIFLFVMSGIVYATQQRTNPEINNYVDALYFTVTSLTTTGYGDILLPGTGGRLLSIVIMIAGVTLFLRLVRALIHPSKVEFECPSCGLKRHDPDAVHCKHCGTVLHIPAEGL